MSRSIALQAGPVTIIIFDEANSFVFVFVFLYVVVFVSVLVFYLYLYLHLYLYLYLMKRPHLYYSMDL